MADQDTQLDQPEAKSELRKLDGILPESVDRRQFFKGALAVTAGGLLAGCSSGGSGGSSGGSGGDSGGSGESGSSGGSGQQTTAGSDVIQRNVVWRSAWKATPNYAPANVAQFKGFWNGKNITPPNVQKGFGSGDTAKRIGTGKEYIGMGSVTPQVPGLAEGYNMSIYGTAKARSQLSLHYRADRVSDPTNLEGKTVVSESALTTQSWPIYAKAVGVEGKELKHAEESAALSMLISGDADAVWGTINDYGAVKANVEKNTDTTLKTKPLYTQVPLYGYTLIVNDDWKQQENNHEYMVRVMEGYSEALKWTILNAEEAITIMREDVNQALQTQSMDDLLAQVKAGVAATNLTDGVKENGLCYLDEEVLKNSIQEIAYALDAEETAVEEAADFSIQEDAELATFTSDEWKQAVEFAQPYADLFQ